jgi:hypothetical protein
MVLQRKSFRVLHSFGQKRMAKRVDVQRPERMRNLITQSAHLGFQYPGLEFFIGMTGLAEYMPTLRFRDQPFGLPIARS